MSKHKAPWTEAEVASLNEYQKDGLFHPFTCANRGDGLHHETHNQMGLLMATTDGWVCQDCDYTQDWAHSFMMEYGRKK